MSKPTPGPWRVGRKVGRTIYCEEAGTEGRLIGVMDRVEDARLTAAAPELLEAVNALMDALAKVHFDAEVFDGPMGLALDAIDKAEGMP